MQPAHVGHHLAYVRREELRESFRRAVAAGEARPFLFPWDFIPTFVLPILYLSISHRRRPWLYQARYLVAAAVTGLNLEMIHKTSSTNIALSYAVGVYAAWGIVWALTLLVWTKPQFEAERVQRVRPSPDLGQDGPQHKTGHGSSPIHSNGHSSNEPSLDSGPRRRKPIPIVLAPDTDVAKSLEHKFEYFWQSFPAEAPFLARLDWAFDLCLAWRGSGTICHFRERRSRLTPSEVGALPRQTPFCPHSNARKGPYRPSPSASTPSPRRPAPASAALSPAAISSAAAPSPWARATSSSTSAA